MVGEVQNGAVTVSYLRGVNPILMDVAGSESYYLYNAHSDVVQLTSAAGAVSRSYDYDAFGNELDPDTADINPFRYCGEYRDTESGAYYLRARYYDPSIGRFTQEDTYWNIANMIYGTSPQKINQQKDYLGLTNYTYAPEISAILQSGNLYVYAINNPVLYHDTSGNIVQFVILGTAISAESIIAAAGAAALSGILIFSDFRDKLANLLKYAYDSTEDAIEDILAAFSNIAAASPTPDPNGNDNDRSSDTKSIKKIKSNKEANKIAKQFGYDNAEQLKQDYVNRSGSHFNMFYNTKTGEVILQSIGNSKLNIPTGLFLW